MNFQMFKLVLEKAEETEIKLPTSFRSLKKQEFQKNIQFCLIDYAKAFDCVDHNKVENSEGGGNTRPPASWETCMQVKKQQLEMEMKQQTGLKLGKEYVMAVYCHPVYFTYIRSAAGKMSGWMNHKLKARLPEEISTTSYMQKVPL